jgi:hypothetical protein
MASACRALVGTRPGTFSAGRRRFLYPLGPRHHGGDRSSRCPASTTRDKPCARSAPAERPMPTFRLRARYDLQLKTLEDKKSRPVVNQAARSSGLMLMGGAPIKGSTQPQWWGSGRCWRCRNAAEGTPPIHGEAGGCPVVLRASSICFPFQRLTTSTLAKLQEGQPNSRFNQRRSA